MFEQLCAMVRPTRRRIGYKSYFTYTTMIHFHARMWHNHTYMHHQCKMHAVMQKAHTNSLHTYNYETLTITFFKIIHNTNSVLIIFIIQLFIWLVLTYKLWSVGYQNISHCSSKKLWKKWRNRNATHLKSHKKSSYVQPYIQNK